MMPNCSALDFIAHIYYLDASITEHPIHTYAQLGTILCQLDARL